MRKFFDTLGVAVPWMCAVLGLYLTFHDDYLKATHFYVVALVLWKINEKSNG